MSMKYAKPSVSISGFCLPTARGRDGYGSGAYMAPRGSRKHKGLDLCVPQGYPLYAPRAGKIARVRMPVYSPQTPAHEHMELVEMTDDDGFTHTLMYARVAQGVRAGQAVRCGDLIAYAQGLAYLYPGIKEHVHYQVRHEDGTYFHPLDFAAMRDYTAEAVE